MGNGGQRHAPATLLQGKNVGSIVGEAALAARLIWAYLEERKSHTPPWVSTTDLPARSESVYRLHYPETGIVQKAARQ